MVFKAAPVSLPPLDDDRADLGEQRAAFARDGHVVLRGLLRPHEVEAYRRPLVDTVERVYGRLSKWERTLYLAPTLWQNDPVAARFITAPRFAGAAATLLGAERVRLWRDVAFFKDPGDPATPWHQDCNFEPLDGHDLVTMWVALNDVSVEMAPLRFASGSHAGGYHAVAAHGGAASGAIEAELGARWPLCSHGPLVAGDVTVHSGWTMHGSPEHEGAARREAVAILLFRDGARVSVPERRTAAGAEEDRVWRAIHGHHMRERLPGLRVGDVAHGDACPIVFPV